MSTETILSLNEAEALRIMREIVTERGADYVYPDAERRATQCQYATYDPASGEPVGPSCIVGHYLIRSGLMAPADLGMQEGINASDVVPYYGRLADAFDAAQDAQDGGAPWGEALADFEQIILGAES